MNHFTPGNLPTPFAYPLYIMAKAAGPACNLACDYCYYLSKSELFGHGRTHMDDSTLERFIKSYIEAQTMPVVQFTWHGGEPTLRRIDFYRKVMELQRKYAGGRRIENSLQTNGTLLTDEWCRFLRDNAWLVGISIDGPEEFHNEYRRTPLGKATFNKVMAGIRLLQRHGVEWNAMAVVNDYNADYPAEFYNFFKEIGCRYLQFTPIVERKSADGSLASGITPGGELTPMSVTPRQWGDFLCGVFDLWVREDVGRMFVQIFDATLAGYVGEEPGLCTMGRNCGHAAVMEHNGDVYACDHFVFDSHYLGNINSQSVTEMMMSERQQAFGASKQAGLTRQCRECTYLAMCNGECPRNRFGISRTGEAGHNFLCEGYHRFFAHSEPYFRFMADELKAGRAPANVMNLFR